MVEVGHPYSVAFEESNQPVEVKCYSGFKVIERPLSFTLRDHEFSIMDIERSWFEEDESSCGRKACFRVRADDGDLYLLSYDEGNGDWTLRRIFRFGGLI